MFRTGLMTTAAVALAWGLASGGIAAAETKKSDASQCMAAMAGGGAEMDADARLQKLDADGNGFVSAEEFKNCLNDMFAKLDANADDRLSAEELQKGHASMMRADASAQQKSQMRAAAGDQKQDRTASTQDEDQSSDQSAAKRDDETATQTAEQEPSAQASGDASAEARVEADTAETGGQTTAQTGAEATAEAEAQPAQPLSEMQVSAEELIGKSVANPNGENLGEIEDLVINPQSEEMFAVVGVGGFLGLGEKKVTIPYNDLQMAGDQIIVLTAQTKDQLKELPEYLEENFRPLRAE